MDSLCSVLSLIRKISRYFVHCKASRLNSMFALMGTDGCVVHAVIPITSYGITTTIELCIVIVLKTEFAWF
jgi:hypothetical protein